MRGASAAHGAGDYGHSARRRREHAPAADSPAAGTVTVLGITGGAVCVVSRIAHTCIPSVFLRDPGGGQEPAVQSACAVRTLSVRGRGHRGAPF
ncbi:putative protein OS=Streptomyces aurantiogriseus OX=66870 GN=GCM10010251_57170 PE=4 SV=1 [Streptomyces aurantiogriseus]